jgi:hypothetical protein
MGNIASPGRRFTEMATKNENLQRAKREKNDEFYTQYEDIEKELVHYDVDHFAGKVVYCPCDDIWSNFWKYFFDNFKRLHLRKLIASHYEKDAECVKAYVFDGQTIEEVIIPGDGDFRSDECVKLLYETDIVCTNVPFSLFREFVALIKKYDKKFLIIGPKNGITYKDFFPLLKENKVWIGYNQVKSFIQPDGKIKQFGNIGWFTNLDIPKRHEDLILVEKYSPEKYPKYDNYDAINVDKVADIPEDYIPCWFHCPLAADCKYAQQKGMNAAAEGCCEKCNGQMGVPITFMDKHNSEQFEIVDADFNLAKPMSEVDPEGIYEKGGPAFYLRDNSGSSTKKKRYIRLYKRIVIRRKKM